MELWIRSQDRHKLELLNDRLLVQETTVNPHSHWYGIMVDGSYLAEYNSEERALEVLDEIQRLIEDLQYMSYAIPNDKFTGYRPNVYEMPKE